MKSSFNRDEMKWESQGIYRGEVEYFFCNFFGKKPKKTKRIPVRGYFQNKTANTPKQL